MLITKGEDLEITPQASGNLFLTGWSKPDIDIVEVNRIVKNPKYGISVKAISGQKVGKAKGVADI